MFDIFAEKASVTPAATTDGVLDSDDEENQSEEECKEAYNEVMSTNSGGEVYEDDQVIEMAAKQFTETTRTAHLKPPPNAATKHSAIPASATKGKKKAQTNIAPHQQRRATLSSI